MEESLREEERRGGKEKEEGRGARGREGILQTEHYGNQIKWFPVYFREMGYLLMEYVGENVTCIHTEGGRGRGRGRSKSTHGNLIAKSYGPPAVWVVRHCPSAS